MAEYIKKEKAVAYIEEQYRLFKDDESKQAIVEGCVEALKFTPTVDVVEVVRCGKCKHYMVAPISGKEFCTVNAMKKNNKWHGLIVTKNDHFCGYGERKLSEFPTGSEGRNALSLFIKTFTTHAHQKKEVQTND